MMEYTQLLTPNTNITVVPDECLQDVREAFGIAATGKYPTAISNWNASPTKHEDEDWPSFWFPIWFTVKGITAGHVAIHAPDNSIYSSSSSTSSTFVHHPNLAAMQQYWANGTILTYLGWTNDVEDTTVIKEGETMSEDACTVLYSLAFPNQPVNENWVKAFTGQSVDNALNAIRDDPSRQAYITKVINDAAAFESGQSVNRTAVMTYINQNLK
jgi:hypothetical protein